MKTPGFMSNPLISRQDVFKFVRQAREKGFNIVPVPLSFIDAVRENFKDVKISALIGYPLGTSSPEAKKVEVTAALKKKVEGIELLLNLSAIKDQDETMVRREIDMVIRASKDLPVRVIIEKSMITPEEGKWVLSILEDFDLVVKDGIGSDPGGIRISSGKLLDKVIHVSMTDLKAEVRPFPENYGLSAGRTLAARYLAEESIAYNEPFSAHNRIVIAPGLLCGFRVSAAARTTIAAKSPLTGSMKSPFILGNTGFLIANIGCKAIVIDGSPDNSEWYLIRITTDSVELLPAGKYEGMGCFTLSEALKKDFGKRIGALFIGPAGEKKYLTSTIVGLNQESDPTEMLSRGAGLGAVFGSKRIKAIVIDPERTGFLPPRKKEEFTQVQSQYEESLSRNTLTGRSLPQYGTSVFVEIADRSGALPTSCFNSGSFNRVEYINHQSLSGKTGTSGIKPGPCCSICSVGCKGGFFDSDGHLVTERPGYECLAGFGSNLGLDSLQEIAKIDRWALDFGVDRAELSVSIAFLLAERFEGDFGNLALIREILNRMESAQGFDFIMNQGVASFGRAFGVNRVPAIRGECLPLFDPRVLKSAGIIPMFSTQGSDLSASGLHWAELLKIRSYSIDGNERLGESYRSLQLTSLVLDNMGLCPNVIFPLLEDSSFMDTMVELCNTALGVRIPLNEFVIRARHTLSWEGMFNQSTGYNQARLPRFLETQALNPSASIFGLNFDELLKVLQI